MTQLVLATIVDGRPIPAGVEVVGTFRLTTVDRGRHALDAAVLLAQGGPMLLTTTEVADELRLSTRQVDRLVKSGLLPSVVIGVARRIDRDDLVAFVAEHKQGRVGTDDTGTDDEAQTPRPGASRPPPPGPRGPGARCLYGSQELANGLD